MKRPWTTRQSGSEAIIQPDDFICDEIRDVRTALPVNCSTRSEETVEKRPRAAHP
jgi:hypothetical protein